MCFFRQANLFLAVTRDNVANQPPLIAATK
jgi:hypothetical protein